MRGEGCELRDSGLREEAASAPRWNNLEGFRDFDIKARTRIWS